MPPLWGYVYDQEYVVVCTKVPITEYTIDDLQDRTLEAIQKYSYKTHLIWRRKESQELFDEIFTDLSNELKP
ncbi:unnamed protein product [Microthlaspi erraticum]|uniref:Uncharacterized protein n=1 Tax=Microthlaspi erraticum TaxID=1685480 RepID=A0A6D2HMY4_9BRAS|nr:unnamed protein product [Microthlaspi erraticum]